MSAQPAPKGARHRRPGRKLGPIAEGTKPAHRAWLEHLRGAYHDSGLTFMQLEKEANWPRSKISELLRAIGRYPRWQITRDLLVALRLPDPALADIRAQWVRAAQEADKRLNWIHKALAKERENGLLGQRPPLDFLAFRDIHRTNYFAYAATFQRRSGEAKRSVSDVFHLLLILWPDALASERPEQYAWRLLRQTVMERAPHCDGHPALAEAAFDTRAQRDAADPLTRIAKTLGLFDAIRRLPALHLDVIVLLHLRGLRDSDVAEVLGVPCATVRAADRHAKRHLTANLRTTT
ncbi:sigma-70 RNA polymerase sigma factor region 4 domain-containing protein [Streptomyces alboflavus]|uniref:sigma-70 family RNA polymerase sigma factor n=1 Tax=Streptomyces alboflavus TaxID=67267 RepID=UPI0036B9A673